ncbi:MAG: hypothetical protein AAB227_11355, partial [Pseudomonadota bacterium]
AFLPAVPAAIAAAAPKNFWLRAIYAGILAGLLLALRRVLSQTDLDIPLVDDSLALIFAAALTFLLAIGAPLWRAAVGFSLIGIAAVVLGASAGLAVVAIETSRDGAPEAAGAAIALAAALGVALSVQMAAAFSRSFAEGGDNSTAAADAARHAAAPALFAMAVGVSAIALAAFAGGGALPAVLASSRVAAGAAAFCLAAPLFMLAGALSLKAKTEMTAVVENRRRAQLRPLLTAIRNLLPPSSAIAASAIILIAAIVAAFETATPASVGEIALISAVAIFSALVFVSLRTALMTAMLVAVAGRLASWGVDFSGIAPPSEIARVTATALAACLSAQLFLAWRDRRNPRRKTREVAQMALADSLFSYVAASLLAIAALGASDVAGVWSEGVEAALYASVLLTIGLVAGPPLMTAIGALFGRD